MKVTASLNVVTSRPGAARFWHAPEMTAACAAPAGTARPGTRAAAERQAGHLRRQAAARQIRLTNAARNGILISSLIAKAAGAEAAG